MKFGVRKPNLKKSFKARTTGRLKRSVKKALIPGYGKKGMGYIKNPKKAVYNKVYNKMTVDLLKPIKPVTSPKKMKARQPKKQNFITMQRNPKPLSRYWKKKATLLINIRHGHHVDG